MSDKKVVGFVPKDQIDKTKYKEDLLDTIDSYKKMIEDDQVDEFVIATKDANGEVSITVCCKTIVGGVGLFEFGKSILMFQ